MNTIFNYKGAEITFMDGDSVMVNATEMAKPFGKRTSDWTRTQSSKDFIDALCVTKKCVTADIIRVSQGGDSQGTWMHEDLALELARWLSPEFAIWCNDRIKELIKHGITATPMTVDKILSDPENAIRMLTELKESRRKAEELDETTKIQSEQLKIQAPKVEYHDRVLESESCHAITKIASELGMSAVKLNAWLKDIGVQWKVDGTWVLKGKYKSMGLTKSKTYIHTNSHGVEVTRVSTYWTEKGRKFIHSLMGDNPLTIKANADLRSPILH